MTDIPEVNQAPLANNASIPEADEQFEKTGFITGESKEMMDGVRKSMAQLEKVKTQLKKDPSDPSILAAYQSALSEYNLFRNAQSNMVKAYKDIGSGIITNFKN